MLGSCLWLLSTIFILFVDAADIWCVGCILAEIVKGEVLFTGRDRILMGVLLGCSGGFTLFTNLFQASRFEDPLKVATCE